MKWVGMYLLGYVLLLAAVLLALWKTGILASIQPFWIGVEIRTYRIPTLSAHPHSVTD